MTKYVIFHVFSKAFPRVDFGRLKLPSYPQKCDFGASFAPSGIQNVAPGEPFSAQGRQKSDNTEQHHASWSRPGSDLAPRASHKAFRNHFGCNFGTQWARHVTLGAPFLANRPPKARSTELPFASWADLGATCDPKPSKDTSS